MVLQNRLTTDELLLIILHIFQLYFEEVLLKWDTSHKNSSRVDSRTNTEYVDLQCRLDLEESFPTFGYSLWNIALVMPIHKQCIHASTGTARQSCKECSAHRHQETRPNHSNKVAQIVWLLTLIDIMNVCPTPQKTKIEHCDFFLRQQHLWRIHVITSHIAVESRDYKTKTDNVAVCLFYFLTFIIIISYSRTLHSHIFSFQELK